MAARGVDLANALVSALNGETFSIVVTAARAWSVFTDQSQLSSSSPVVSVVPQNVALNRASGARRVGVRQWGLLVAVQQKLKSAEERTQLDDLYAFVEELAEFIEPNEQSAAVELSGAQYVDTLHEDGEPFVADHLLAGLASALTVFVFEDER